jgi:hypothetical protein
VEQPTEKSTRSFRANARKRHRTRKMPDSKRTVNRKAPERDYALN